MNDLKISEASKNIRDLVLSKSWWDSQERTELLENKIQKAINSELDRVAGPLVEALEKIIGLQPCLEGGGCFYPMHDGEGNYIGEQTVDPIGVINGMVQFAADAMDNYRKERGE